MPLAQTWDPARFDLEPDRITSEDIEAAVDACFPDTRVEFIPAGFFGEIPTIMKYLGIKPPPFMGAHPNCESMYLLVSDGERYLPLEHYLRTSLTGLMKAFLDVEKKLAWRTSSSGSGVLGGLLGKLRMKERYLALRTILSIVWILKRHARLGRALKGRWAVAKAWHAVGVFSGLLFGRTTRTVLERHTTLGGVLQLIVLPFEDPFVLETDRLERCPNAFAYFDPEEDRVKTVPVCAWPKYKSEVLRKVVDYYAGASVRA